MTREEAAEKALTAYKLLKEIHEERHKLGKLFWREQESFIITRFATTDAVQKAERLAGILSGAPVPA